MDGKTIKRERKRRGWSQRELAAKIGTGTRTIGAWERGENSPDRSDEMLRDLFANEPPKSNGETTVPRPLGTYSEVALLDELMHRAAIRDDS